MRPAFLKMTLLLLVLVCLPGLALAEQHDPSKLPKPYKVQVDHVSFWSPLGLKAGDEITSINGKPFSHLGVDTLDELYTTVKSEGKVVLRYRRAGQNCVVTRSKKQMEEARRK
jgi:C-terminal processing protease CtpA/Prc